MTLRFISSRMFRKVANSAAKSLRRRLEVRPLEDRAVPAAFTVTTTGDQANGKGGSGSAGDLRYCIAQAELTSGLDTISFDSSLNGASITLNASGGPLAISYPLIINGPGSVGIIVQASNNSRILNVADIPLVSVSPNAQITISKMTFEFGEVTGSESGGAILCVERQLTLTDCTLKNNTSAAHGGAIFVTESTLTMTDCTVTTNLAQDGASTTTDGGGIFATTSTVTLTNVYVTDCTAGGNGGGIAMSSGSLLLTDCGIQNNIAGQDGGGISQFDGTMSISGGYLQANTAASNGGGVYSEVATEVTSVDFLYNVAGEGGAGAEITGDGASLVCEKSQFASNAANFANPDAEDGGGIRFRNVSTTTQSVIVDTTFEELYVSKRGGSVSIIGSGKVAFTSSTEEITSETQISSGGVVDPSIQKVNSNGLGGGIYIGALDGKAPTVEIAYYHIGAHFGGTDDGNFAGFGGNIAIEGEGVEVAISHCLIDYGGDHDGNTKLGIVAGGNIYVSGTGSDLVSIDDCTIDMGVAVDGAGLFIDASTVTINESEIKANVASGLGGGLFVAPAASDTMTLTSTVTLNTNTIYDNTAVRGGGTALGDGTIKLGSYVTIDRCTIEANTATGDDTVPGGGGGISINRGLNVVVMNCTINANSAVTFGGGIYFPRGAAGGTTYNIRNSTIHGNLANKGGGITIDGNGSSDLRIYNSTIAANTATFTATLSTQQYFGGGILFQGFSGSDIVHLESTIVATNICDTTYKNGTEGPDISGSGQKVNAIRCLIGVADNGGWTFNTSTKNHTGTLSTPLDPNFDGGLADHGGPTLTLALKSTSIAIDNGYNPLGLSFDQRYTGNPRVNNAFADIGAYEFPSDNLPEG